MSKRRRPSDAEIREQRDRTIDPKTGENVKRYRGLTFEEGVDQALSWVLGDSDELPMPEED